MTASSTTSSAVNEAPVTSRDKRLIMGNWKMHGSLDKNQQLLESIKAGASSSVTGQVNVAVCVPFPYLAQAREMLQGSFVTWGAQDVSPHPSGAYTGEVSASMLKDFSCRWTLVGHSERRSLHGETDTLVANKAVAALSCGITPVVCVGESLEQRDAGQLEAVIQRQLKPLLDLGEQALERIVVAYEPVWAIGTGRSATADQAQQVHEFIRGLLGSHAHGVPLLYGGSVKPDNAAELFAMPDIDGALVGGASLVANDFMAIAGHAASER